MIIPVFIPYQGCPHKCIYCRQDKITSQPEDAVHGHDVQRVIEQARKSKKFPGSNYREVAFYGGTFTSLGFDKMEELLDSVSPYIYDGIVDSIRISTRPDEIDEKERQQRQPEPVEQPAIALLSTNDIAQVQAARCDQHSDDSEAHGDLV